MSKVLAVNGSPRMAKGRTEMLLAAFLRGMQAAGADTDTIYPSRMKIERCDCNQLLCWFGHPGRCSHEDDMEAALARLREVDTVVIASPVYVPLPGALQDFLNRMCPLMDPCSLPATAAPGPAREKEWPCAGSWRWSPARGGRRRTRAR